MGGIVSAAPAARKMKAAGSASQILVTWWMAQPFLDDGRGQVTLPDFCVGKRRRPILMSEKNHSTHDKSQRVELAAQLRAAAELLEKAAADRAILGELSQEDRARLLK